MFNSFKRYRAEKFRKLFIQNCTAFDTPRLESEVLPDDCKAELDIIYKDGDKNLPFANGDYVFIPDVKKMVQEKLPTVKAYAVKADGKINEFELSTGDLTDDERKIILAGCLINYYKE